MIAEFALIWSSSAVAAAVLGGLGIGIFVVGAFASSPTYASGIVPPAQVAFLIAALGTVIGIVFYVGQAIASFTDGDQLWPRVVARFGVWLVYAVALGFGTYVRLDHDARRRRARLLERAKRELSGRRPK